MLLVHLFYLLEYSPNWLVGSLPTIIGNVVIGICTLVNVEDENSDYILIILVRIIVTVCIFPYLLYRNEKQMKFLVFNQWIVGRENKKIDKFLNQLPIGILLYSHSKLTFSNCFAQELLLGNDQGSLINIIKAIEENEGLRSLIQNNINTVQDGLDI